MNLLDDRQLAPFRKEYLEREKEIQRYIGVYLSGVVIVFGWIIGPQSKPLNEMALGNDGYNIFAFLIISVVNALFITFLIYKSLDVHDTTQFITVLAQPNSVYTFWENWRRSTYSATKPVRTAYFIALAFLPAIMALMLLLFSGIKIFSSEASLRNQLTEIEESRRTTQKSITYPDPNVPTPVITPIDVSFRLERIQSVFSVARWLFLIVGFLHLVPLWFFYRNTVPTKKKWDVIAKLKEAQAHKVSPCSKEVLHLQEFVENSGVAQRVIPETPTE
ncbi:MAG: hypothetical protein AABM67_21435 [Acidobacteriota bacterium]